MIIVLCKSRLYSQVVIGKEGEKMQLHQLRYIVKVSQVGSFSLAAKELFVTQPTLSQQIINLEKELGVKLFVRQAKNIAVTPAGNDFVKSAKHILAEVDVLSEHMKKFTSMERGTANVGIMWSASYLGISQKIQEFTDKFPKVEVNIEINGSHILPSMIFDRLVDAIFYVKTGNELNHEEILYKRIIKNKMAVVISRDHALSEKETITFEDLKREALLLPSTDENLKQVLKMKFLKMGVTPRIFCESNLADIMIRLAGEKMGVAFVSEKVAEGMLTPSVKMIPLEPVIDRSVFFAVRKEALSNPVVEELTKFILKKY